MSILGALLPGTTPSEAEIRKLYESQQMSANRSYLLEDLFPKVQENIINHLRGANTTEELWTVKGAQRTLDEMVALVKAKTKTQPQ